MARDQPSDCDWGLHVKMFEHRISIASAIRPGESWNQDDSNVFMWTHWNIPKLKRSDAQWLREEMRRIGNEVRQRHCNTGEPFLVGLAFAPFHDQSG
jgi:hypothetical protein